VTGRLDVYLEGGQKRVVACALDGPGWCRAGKTEDAALDALVASAPQYALVLEAIQSSGFRSYSHR
jgi:hypothetical protein